MQKDAYARYHTDVNGIHLVSSAFFLSPMLYRPHNCVLTDILNGRRIGFDLIELLLAFLRVSPDAEGDFRERYTILQTNEKVTSFVPVSDSFQSSTLLVVASRSSSERSRE